MYHLLQASANTAARKKLLAGFKNHSPAGEQSRLLTKKADMGSDIDLKTGHKHAKMLAIIMLSKNMWNSIHGFQGEEKKIMMSFKKNKQSLIFILLIVISLTFPVLAQQEPQKEFVQVVNVEMILRVLKDGSPVAGLKKNDFTLFEDGEKSEINGFFEIHRRIAPGVVSEKQLAQPRLYLLFFWVGNPAADVEGVLNKFFSTIYREGDRVILSTPLKTFELTSRQDITSRTVAFLEQWRQEAKIGLSKRLQFHDNINRMCEDLIRRLTENFQQEKQIHAFIPQYSAMIQEYQLRELSPDMSALEAMANSLIPIKNDKFALFFFQHDTLPFYDISNVRSLCSANGIADRLVDILADAMLTVENQAKIFFTTRRFSEKLKSLFIQANTQFHLLFLSPDRSDVDVNVSSLLPLTKSEEIYSNWDQVLREISKNTGGLMLDGDRMVEALDQATSFEDIYYQITYVPRGQGAKKREIDIRVDRPGMKVIYGRTLEIEELPLVKIAEISANNRFIRFAVVDFYPIPKDGVPTGFVNIYVTGRQADNEPSRLLLSQASETAGTIDLPFVFPQPGFWDLEVRVVDQITGRQDVKKARVEIAAAIPPLVPDIDPDPALIALLSQGAAYAEKLKETAFSFFCREDVTQDVFAIEERYRGRSSRTYWIYDYQIIGRDGKIMENRILLEKNREKSRQEKAQLETVYRSFYSFYMPVTVLAGEKQHLYQYRLLGKKKKIWHIAVVRRDPSLPIPWGEIWVSEEDGAVLKIQIEQTSIVGFEKLAARLNKQGLVPAVTTIHEYDIEKNQIRFPSKTVFIERYNSDFAPIKTWGQQQTVLMGRGHSSFEHSRTYFEYNDYRFFYVTASVKEKIE